MLKPEFDPRERMTLPPWARQGAIALFAAALVVLGSIHQPKTSWNVNSRLALVFAVVDHRTFAIDGYHEPGERLETMDKAVFKDHYYSDKVFGVSVLGIPFYAVLRLIGALFQHEWSFGFVVYVLRMMCSSMPAALSVALLWLLLVRGGASPRRAVFAAAVAFFGSLWFGYSTVFMPYSAGIAACLAALYVLLYPSANRMTLRNTFAIGLLCGFAMICDFIFGLIVIGIGVVFLMRLADQTGIKGMRCFAEMSGPRTPIRRAAWLLGMGALGGALPLAAFFAYTYSIFGRLSIPYEYEAMKLFKDSMAEGFMGIKSPKPGPLWFLTVHPYRGIFFWSPWTILAIIGCVMGTRSAGRRRLWGWLGLWTIVAYLIFNAGYYMWWGGWAMGPRLLLPIMVAVPMGLAEICRRDLPVAWWRVLIGAGVIAILLNAPLSMMDPELPQGQRQEILENARVGDRLYVPQFEYLKVFYLGLWHFPPPEAGGVVWYRFMPLLGTAAAIALLIFTARRLPEKYLPWERLEVPLVHFDGTAAPPPMPVPRKVQGS